MGGSNETISKEDIEKFELMDNKEYPNFCICSKVRNRETNDIYFEFRGLFAIDNKEKEQQNIENQIKTSNAPNTGNLIQFKLEKSKQLCFEHFRSIFYFEYNDYSINTLSKNYISNNSKVPERDGWKILHCVGNHLKALDTIGSFHMDLKPEYIYFTDDMNDVKVINPLSYTKFNFAYNVLLGESKISYVSPLSPELMTFLKMKSFYPNVDHIKCDLFSLALIVLCFLTGLEWEKFYNFNSLQIDLTEIKIALSKLYKMNYSDEMFYILDQCLNKDPIDRPHMNQFMQMTNFKINKL